jgi:hypothetical protein
MNADDLDNILKDPNSWAVTQFNKRSASMILNNREKELIIQILMYYSANSEEINTKIYPLDDPILVRPEKHEIFEIIRWMYESMKQN